MHMNTTEIPDVDMLDTLFDENGNLSEEGHDMLSKMEANGEFS